MSIVSNIKGLGQDILDLVFPSRCVSCDARPLRDHIFCLSCNLSIGGTDHFDIKDNKLIQRLGHRVNAEHGAALYYFIKNGKVQDALHRLKYGRDAHVGHVFGRIFGKRYLESTHFTPADYIVPVPVYYRKEQKRGYNQSLLFARGISEITKIPIYNKLITKKASTISLTQKNRSERYNGLLSSLQVRYRKEIEGKSILIVDDVLTTGATIEAVVSQITKQHKVNIQIGTIALAID